MTKPGKMHCVIDIETIGEEVRTRRNLANRGFWDTVIFTVPNSCRLSMWLTRHSQCGNSSKRNLEWLSVDDIYYGRVAYDLKHIVFSYFWRRCPAL